MKKLKDYITLLALSISYSTITFANNDFSDQFSIEFFASNNTSEINLQTAFNRLQGKEQQDLQNETIKIMQKNHMEQSTFENLLGTYKMSNDQNITADNSEKIITSSYQILSQEKTFKLASKLATTLKQESVAILVPDRKSQMVADTVIKLKSHHYTINETIKLIHDKLPAQYSQAFSLHLNNNVCSTFDNTIVDEIEWLGSKVKPEEIKKSFPQEEITFHYGKAYLVYKNGQKEQL
ncbi:MAG: hypothetical protein KIT56_09765 [Gammaproteobacteria bacterium]|nr:hypothetical protein [Gammaproteobacteria bacterium]MCW5584138.1 hypothetical protein [Gammaproteobacteria bacterium]